ncbi:MAG: cell surface protein SprA [Ignavibacteria bacterium]|nr:cell surface protein SprA [Ignavibacteria bacterium]
MVAFSTSVLASSRPNAAGEPLHAACVQAVSWTLSAYILPLLQDSTKPPTVIDRYDSGDPNNTDLPRYFPTSTINRYGTSPAQRRDRTIPIPKGYSAVGYVDSLLDNVTLREMLDGVDVGTMVPITMEGYLAQQREAMTRKLRDSSLLAYEMKKPMSSAELTKLIDQATNITIPLPQNAIFGIFGKPEVSINVNGEVNVQAGWRWDTQRLGTASVLGQTQSAPIFNQNIQVNVSGRIGDKFRMNVDWNTLNQFEFNNRFKVGYEGYDDDIIKRVEFGNVNLETQSTLIGGGQTLFGVRADFQFGPLYLKTIASQRRGERKIINARGGSARQMFTVRAYDYTRNHFFLDTAYFPIWRSYFKSATPVLPPEGAPVVVKEIEVWESTTDLREVQANDAVAIDDLAPIRYLQGETYPNTLKSQEIKAGSIERGRFTRLDNKRYEIDFNLGTLTILNLRTDRYYAVAYRTEGPTTDNKDDLYHGTLTNTVNEKDTLILKLVARPQMQPGFRLLWKRLMKNIYNIGVANVNPQDARIGMWYYRSTNDSTDVLEGAPDKIPTIFRIDQVNNGTGAAPPDGAFDARPPVFNSQRGEITFPSLEPFREGIREYFASKGNAQLAEQYVFNEVYDTTDAAARLVTAKDRFLLVGEAAGTATGNRIPLAYQLAPGSVRVTLDGAPLREGVDYTVDYYTGTMSLLNARATLPNANLNIEYEQNDIFNLTTRTLLGLRADMVLFNKRRMNGSIGMTLMNYDQAAIVDRVMPGQEPNSNFMMGFDAKFNAELPWLTRALDVLPGLDTKEKSTWTFTGEWAMVSPTPNKRTSTVASDAGKAVAYVDDFESARRYLSFGLTPTVWQHSSPSKDVSLWDHDTNAVKFKGKTFWYQKFVPDVPQADVYPNRARVQGRNNINPIRLVFEPRERGIYNPNPEFLDAKNPRWNDADSLNVRATTQSYIEQNRPKIWGGMLRLLSPFNTNFDNDNIDYIEIMMKIDAYEAGSRMFIDLGQISEDVIPNQRLNTEDNPPANNLIDVGEDRGIDTLTNDREKVVYPDPLNREADPARDDYFFDFNADRQNQNESQFVQYNNFEGNSTQSELGQFPDTEILNKNNGQTISLDNSYFRYEVQLNPNPSTNPQIVGGNPPAGWFLFRIPVRRPDTVVGNPLFTNIQYARVHFQGGTVKVSIADWGVVGSYWLRNHQFQPNVSSTDSVLQVAYVNREENQSAPDFYTMPPGVQPPQQLQNPDPYQQVYLNEQSLVIKARNLRYGEERFAARIFRPWDLFYYKEVAFFIHGDNTMPSSVTEGSTPPAYCFVRYGVDSANYYEYRRPLLRGWQDLRIVISDLTAIKERRDQSRTTERQEFSVPGDPQGIFAIKGNPIMTRVTFFGFGIANPAERYPNELSTSMWVDELRVVEPTNDNDWAGLASTTLKLADVGDITASINHTTPNYHRLEDRFGNRMQATAWNATVQLGLEKFLPKELKETRIPVTYTHTELAETPKYQAQNDVELDAAAAAAAQDTLDKGGTAEAAAQASENVKTRSQRVRVQDQWAVTGLKLGIPSKAWYLDDTFNKLTFNFAYAQEFERSQVVQQRFDWRWRLRIDYAVTLPAKYDVSPLKFLTEVWGLKAYKDMKINFLPQTITANLGMTRARTTEQSRFLLQPSPIIREFIAEKSFGFNWRLVENGFLSPVIDYKVISSSTLVPLEMDQNGRQRTGGQIADQMFFSNGQLFNFGPDNNFGQTITFSFRPKLPDIFGLNRLLETTGSYNVVYGVFDPLQPDPAQRDVVRTARYTSNFRLSPVFRWRQFGAEMFGPSKKGADDFGSVLQDIFFGFENFTFTFNQTNTALNNGILGGTGITNLWARSLTFRDNDPMWGPSTPYQLGLISNPHGDLNLVGSSAFPFFKFETTAGVRPSNAVMVDDYTQRSTFQFQTNRPLWPGATLDLNMRTDVGYSRNQRVVTDAAGIPTFTNINKRQTLERSFISFPDMPFGLFNDNVENVITIYNGRKAAIEADPDTVGRNARLLEALATSFREGFESLDFISGEIGRVLPAINWTLRWDGIEKIAPFRGIAQRIFLEHAYQSTYTENARINDNGRVIEVQQIKSGFTPLIGLNLSFDERRLNGLLTATGRYSVTTTHGLNASARSVISRETSHEIQIQASYLRRGVSLKILGLDLQNDMEFTFNTQIRRNLRAQYDVTDFKGADGSLVDGTTQIIIEPRARYTISNRVTASAFFRYEGNFSEGAANPGFSTTQVGLDIRLSISGGR